MRYEMDFTLFGQTVQAVFLVAKADSQSEGLEGT